MCVTGRKRYWFSLPLHCPQGTRKNLVICRASNERLCRHLQQLQLLVSITLYAYLPERRLAQVHIIPRLVHGDGRKVVATAKCAVDMLIGKPWRPCFNSIVKDENNTPREMGKLGASYLNTTRWPQQRWSATTAAVVVLLYKGDAWCNG